MHLLEIETEGWAEAGGHSAGERYVSSSLVALVMGKTCAWKEHGVLLQGAPLLQEHHR